MLVYRGPSVLDGAEIIGVLTQSSANIKTGDVCTLWIMRADVAPHVAQRTGADASVCGACPLRPMLKGASRCYVSTWQGPRATWQSHLDSGCDPDLDRASSMVQGRTLRLGGYGDPAALPWDVVSRLVDACANVLGYTHQWRDCDARFASCCMASCETEEHARMAHARGWRTFRTRSGAGRGATMAKEITCPASREAGAKRTCAQCGACNGAGVNAGRASIAIDDHGATAQRRA